MPGAARRIYPARTSKRWLGTSASAGSSRNVRRNRLDIRRIIWGSPRKREQSARLRRLRSCGKATQRCPPPAHPFPDPHSFPRSVPRSDPHFDIGVRNVTHGSLSILRYRSQRVTHRSLFDSVVGAWGPVSVVVWVLRSVGGGACAPLPPRLRGTGR